jgi:hypothetical protein
MRLKFWKDASFQTRNICLSINRLGEFNLRDDSDDDDNEDEVFESFVYLAACPHPPILHTCHESRVEGFKHYTLDFGVEQKRSWPLFTFSSPARVFVNWKVDGICILEGDGQKIMLNHSKTLSIDVESMVSASLQQRSRPSLVPL